MRRIFGGSLLQWRKNPRARWAVQRSRLFDATWYCTLYPEVISLNIDPLSHYLTHGGSEGRAPSAAFDGARYLAENPDVAQSGCNPLVHYLFFGIKEGRKYFPASIKSHSPRHTNNTESKIAFCVTVDANDLKRDIAFCLVASWHRHCREWSSLHVVVVGEYPEFSRFAQNLGANISERNPHPLAGRLAFANKWLLADLDVGTARPIVIDWDIVFVGDPWLLRALPTHSFGARLAPALRLPPALQHWAMQQFNLPRGLNVAALEVATQYETAQPLQTSIIAEVTREFRYYNGGLIVIPPGLLRNFLKTWQSSYELMADRILGFDGAKNLPGMENSTLTSDQLALAIALAWESVHPLDPTSNFFPFDAKFGYMASEVSILHLAGPVVGQGLQSALDTFDSQAARWNLNPAHFPRFDVAVLRNELASLARDYGSASTNTGEAHRKAAPAGREGAIPRHANRQYQENIYYDDEQIASAIAQGQHREMVGGMWQEIGQLQFRYLKEKGLRPTDHLLDIGCGSLRGGIHFAAYLEPGHYWGVDTSAPLLQAGRKELEDAGVSSRVPDGNLLQESEFDFERLGREFDFALAQSLFTHLPVNKIRLCLYRLAKVMPPGGRVFATYLEAPEHHRLDAPFHHPGGITSHGHKDPFHYRRSAIAALIATAPWRLVATEDWGHPRDQRMMILERLPTRHQEHS